ncbi:MAG: hypothetical protein FWD44_09445 [Oscillospiraceae bacterium]|nr:hypothetical protein [Oscillospiraceae bacterium]
MDKLRFNNACDIVMRAERESKQIGTLGEKTLHAVVKYYLEPDETKHEIRVGSFHADIVNERGITEIQTRSFYALRKKLAYFLEESPVTVVYPLAGKKWLLWINTKTGEITKKRKSPRKGRIHDAIFELYRIKSVLNHPNLKLHLMFIDVEEYRYLDGWSENKKRGSSRCDRHPVNIAEEFWFEKPADYLQFIPDKLKDGFTTKDYKKAAGINLTTAQLVLNVLHHIGTVRRTGKQGNMHVYERALLALF